MKKTLSTLTIIAFSYYAYAQTNIHESGGNVGIGTSGPTDKLDVNGNISLSGGAKELRFRSTDNSIKQFVWLHESNALGLGSGVGANSMFISPAGNVGIGTTTPKVKLDVTGTANFATAAGNYTLSAGGSGGDYGSIGYNQQYGSTSGVYTYKVNDYASILKFFLGGFDFMTARSGTIETTIPFVSAMRITQSGNVGIGTTNPDAKLAVNGTIHSKEVKVDLTNWPDYVFKPDYSLLPLNEVKTYIDKHQRLPEMPSEQDVTKNGLSLGEVVKLQTKKIEELTLYLIEQYQQNTHQQQINQLQQEQINELKNQLSRLIKQK